MPQKWLSAIVINGTQHGRTIGFPTANLDPRTLPSHSSEGVYSCVVSYENREYAGTLFFGPRLILKERHRVLEIHIIDFNEQIYGKEIAFKILGYIRGVKNFSTTHMLQKALQNDLQIAKQHFSTLP